jgi:hypothetical protein
MDKPSNKIFSTTVLVCVTLLSLFGGVAAVIRSLRKMNLTLLLELKKDDKREKKY